ncbi:uncharacterized protein LOC132264634 isoform X2 [Phlebotomus argentipes]|uniref:uncharacterized protein LOC132264634 isoform X2 n=1 Tax=Phlebotomus argentipes TaxID=94469 RepID=UPI002892C4B9|nr:uncharacterized protein LOC132264634 isoform X2 [Phlebotomus argentipes]
MKVILGLLILISLYKDSVEGSCLSYGHSCWGAHGKRSSSRVLPRPPPHINLPTRWALLKIIPDKNLLEMKAKMQGNALESLNDSRFFRSLGTADSLDKTEESESFTPSEDTFDDRQNSNANLKKLFFSRDSRESEDLPSNDMDNDMANNVPKTSKFYKFMDPDSSKMYA